MNNHSLSSEELTRYSQHIKLEEIGIIGQEKLKNARVLCVGLGGLGSPLLLYLAAAGVGTLGLVDDDEVDLSNLQRQILYNASQVHLNKTTAAAKQLLALNPLIQINSHTEKLTKHNAAQLINQYDIIADASDNFYTHYLIHDTCFELKKPYVYASASQFQGYCSIFSGNNGPCLRCLFPVPPNNDLVLNCNEVGVLNVLPGILGMIQATEILKWILNAGNSLEKRLLMIDLLKMTFKEIHLAQNPECQLCVQHQSKEDLINPLPPCENTLNLRNHSITALQLNKFLGKHSAITLIDVRTSLEHKAQNIGGISVPLSELSYRLNELNPKDHVILYCQSGKRSLLALNILIKAGFSSVQHLEGGVNRVTLFENFST